MDFICYSTLVSKMAYCSSDGDQDCVVSEYAVLSLMRRDRGSKLTALNYYPDIHYLGPLPFGPSFAQF